MVVGDELRLVRLLLDDHQSSFTLPATARLEEEEEERWWWSSLLRAAHSRARSAAVKGRGVEVVLVLGGAAVVDGVERDGDDCGITEGREIGEELLCVYDGF